MNPGDRLAELRLELPQAGGALGSYVSARRAGSLLYLSGHVAKRAGEVVAGQVGADVDVATAHELARRVALDLMASAADAVGGINRVAGVVKLLGMVRSAPGFDQQPAVINGASDVLIQVFGGPGRHARSAVGVSDLPGGAVLEIEAIFEVL